MEPLSSSLWYLQQTIGNLWQLCEDKMRHTTLTHALLFSSLAYGQSSSSPEADGLTATAGSASATVGTVTIDGTPTTFNVPFTVPASADVGPNLLPNIYDPQATQAQDVCPGYTASNVEYTESGFTASLTLAGAPVGVSYLS